MPLTYADLITYGLHENQIAAAMREAQALGFAQCTRRGHGGNAEFRAPNLWRLTYVQNIGPLAPTDEWKRIETLEQAKAIAATARAEKDPLKVALGKSRKSRNHPRNPGVKPPPEIGGENVKSPPPETGGTGSPRKPGVLSIFRGEISNSAPKAQQSSNIIPRRQARLTGLAARQARGESNRARRIAEAEPGEDR